MSKAQDSNLVFTTVVATHRCYALPRLCLFTASDPFS